MPSQMRNLELLILLRCLKLNCPESSKYFPYEVTLIVQPFRSLYVKFILKTDKMNGKKILANTLLGKALV